MSLLPAAQEATVPGPCLQVGPREHGWTGGCHRQGRQHRPLTASSLSAGAGWRLLLGDGRQDGWSLVWAPVGGRGACQLRWGLISCCSAGLSVVTRLS